MALMHCRVLGLPTERGGFGKQCTSPCKVMLSVSMVGSVTNGMLRPRGSNDKSAKSRTKFLADGIAIYCI